MSANDQDAAVWWIYRGTGRPMHDLTKVLPAPPSWRTFHSDPVPEHNAPPTDDGEADRKLGTQFHLLGLGRALRRPVTSRTSLQSGLYSYDAIGRAQAAATRQSGEPPIGDFVRLGPFGTAFPPSRLRRVLLIDELDKCEADLPNDLLRLFEEGESAIQELSAHNGDLRVSAMAFRRRYGHRPIT